MQFCQKISEKPEGWETFGLQGACSQSGRGGFNFPWGVLGAGTPIPIMTLSWWEDTLKVLWKNKSRFSCAFDFSLDYVTFALKYKKLCVLFSHTFVWQETITIKTHSAVNQDWFKVNLIQVDLPVKVFVMHITFFCLGTFCFELSFYVHVVQQIL